MVKTSTNRNVDNQNVDKPKRRQTETSKNQNVDKPKRRQTKTSTNQNVDRPKRRQAKTSTDRNVDKPKRRQTKVDKPKRRQTKTSTDRNIDIPLSFICFHNLWDVFHMYLYMIYNWSDVQHTSVPMITQSFAIILKLEDHFLKLTINKMYAHTSYR